MMYANFIKFQIFAVDEYIVSIHTTFVPLFLVILLLQQLSLTQFKLLGLCAIYDMENTQNNIRVVTMATHS